MCALGELRASGTRGVKGVALARQVVAIEVRLQIGLAADLPRGTHSVHIVLPMQVIAVGLFLRIDGLAVLRGAFIVTRHLRAFR